MIKLSFLKKYGSLFLVTLFISVACNNDSSTDKSPVAEPAKTETENTTSAATTPPAVMALSGKLDTLWVDSLSFTKLDKNKAVFVFYAGNDDTLTLHGWKDKGGSSQFNTDPDVRLLKGRPSGLSYGPGTYFGNVNMKDVNKITHWLDTAKQAKYVVFAPQLSGGHVSYKIYISNENPMALVKIFTVVPTGEEANPSPPKNY